MIGIDAPNDFSKDDKEQTTINIVESISTLGLNINENNSISSVPPLTAIEKDEIINDYRQDDRRFFQKRVTP